MDRRAADGYGGRLLAHDFQLWLRLECGISQLGARHIADYEESGLTIGILQVQLLNLDIEKITILAAVSPHPWGLIARSRLGDVVEECWKLLRRQNILAPLSEQFVQAKAKLGRSGIVCG